MKCTGCALPLSPLRTHCPRCGTAAGEPEAKNQAPQYAFSSFPEQNNVSANVDTLQEQNAAASQTNNEIADQPFPSPETEQTPEKPEMPLLPGLDKPLRPEQDATRRSSSQPKLGSSPPDEFRTFPQPTTRPRSSHSRSMIQPGFTIASLFVLAGGLILLFVYILSFHLPPLSNENHFAPVAVNTPIAQSITTRSKGNSRVDATSTAQITPEFPGKVYIDNAQIGSNLNLNTAQLYQATTNFTVNQKIFVTFMLHPGNSGGAVCLHWYVNQQQFSQFTFTVGAMSQHAYSYAFATSAGQGSVAIYWASSTACTDKVLAQVVNFTINS